MAQAYNRVSQSGTLAAQIGAVYVTVNTNYKQSELEYLCQNSDMHTLCIVNGEKDSDFVQMTYTMLPELKTCQRGHLKSERFPYMKNVIYVGQEKHRGMYNTAEILLLGDNIEDSRLNELKSQVTCHDAEGMHVGVLAEIFQLGLFVVGVYRYVDGTYLGASV